MAVEAEHDTLGVKRLLWSSISLVLLLYLLYRCSPAVCAFVLSSSPVIICATLLLGVVLSYGSTHHPGTHEDRRTSAYTLSPKFGRLSRYIHFEEHKGYSLPAVNEDTIYLKRRDRKNTSLGKARANKYAELDGSVAVLKVVDQRNETVDANDRPTSVSSMTVNHERELKVPFSSKDKGDENAKMFGVAHQGKVDGKEAPHGLCCSSENYEEDSEMVVKKNQDSVLTDSQSDEVLKVSLDQPAEKPDSEMLVKTNQDRLLTDSQSDEVRKVSQEEPPEKPDSEMVVKTNQDRVLTDSQSDEVRKDSEDQPAEKLAGARKWGRAFSVRQRKKLADIKVEAISSHVCNQLDSSSLGSPFARTGSHNSSSGFYNCNAESSSSDVLMADVAPVLDEIDPLLGAQFPGSDPIDSDDLGTGSYSCPRDFQIYSDGNDEAGISKTKNDAEEVKKDNGDEQPTSNDEKSVMDLGYSEVERNRRLEKLMVRRRSKKNITFDLDRNLIDRDTPGTAPSVMHPLKDLFEVPFEQSDDSQVASHDSLEHQGFNSGSLRDILLSRHDSLKFGSQERRISRFKPCTMGIVEESTSNFLGQFSDRNMSEVSAVTESETISSAADQDCRDDLIRKDFLGENASLHLLSQDGDLAYVGSKCSDVINFVDDETLNHVASGMESEQVQSIAT